MFEVADSTFEDINQGFSKLITGKIDFDTITALNLYKFSKEYFEWYNEEWNKKEERFFFKLSNELKKINIKSIEDLKKILSKYERELQKYETFHYRQGKNLSMKRYFNPVGLIRAAMALEYGRKFDLAFGLNGYSERVNREINLAQEIYH